MDTQKVQSSIAEVSNEGVVVQNERPNGVDVSNKLAELFHVGSVLTKHDRSDGSIGSSRNHKRLDWLDGVNPSKSSRDCQELGTGYQSTNMAEDATSSVGGHGASQCIEGGFKCLDHSGSGSDASGNSSDGVGNKSCHCKINLA